MTTGLYAGPVGPSLDALASAIVAHQFPPAGENDVEIKKLDVNTWLTAVGVEHAAGADSGDLARRLIEVAIADGGAGRIWTEVATPPPGVMGYLVPRTYFYIKIKGLSRAKFALYAGLSVSAVTQSLPQGALATGLAALLDSVKRLSEPQAEMLRRMQSLAAGRLYEVWLREVDIVDDWPAGEENAARIVLGELRAAGVLQEAAGLWRTVF